MNALRKFRDSLIELLFTQEFTLFEVLLIYFVGHLIISHLHWS